ncbi:hypothetical protein [Actinomadura fibrosa]|uniref:Uncharacterized protein n=1 Tax=Actinomadura fibrosa TaxID=111802 RepID=A0ABW2XLR3_9ACTN|nr:hypothetical protein [Actinomadura fibrosa]
MREPLHDLAIAVPVTAMQVIMDGVRGARRESPALFFRASWHPGANRPPPGGGSDAR